MKFGFSYTGLVFLIMLFMPNFLWAKYKPENYDEYAKNESKILLAFERAGEVAVTCLVLVFSSFNPQGLNLWLLWLAGALLLMVLYEVYWVRYFRSSKTMKDFYSSLLGIPVAGATLPVCAVLLIAVYGKNPFLFAAGIILGIGHIGIHLAHRKDFKTCNT
ncbi:MAG: hypothetical protein IKY00_05395 [Clostridia bacterium]|nr:hypothetical protein [Clostridia bacterium]